MGVEVDSPLSFLSARLSEQVATFRRRAESRLKLGLSLHSLNYGLLRDLSVPIEHPAAKIPISVRPMRDGDLDLLLPDDPSLPAQERMEANWRRGFARNVGGGGFVAIDERDGSPCYMQWLLKPAQNNFIAKLKTFPLLREGEALLENAYTPPSHRGLGIMSAAMALIAEQASGFGARYVMTFVGHDNIASLKGCRRAGFSPDMLHIRHDNLFGVIRRNRFERLADGDPRRNWETVI
jgi:RimJ/RimL family protein N-acetyltransferase